jgi:hypothetical protein
LAGQQMLAGFLLHCNIVPATFYFVALTYSNFSPNTESHIQTGLIKISLDGTIYHCISRTINGAHPFDEGTKEIRYKPLHQVTEFPGAKNFVAATFFF